MEVNPKKLDAFVKKYIKEMPLDSPSKDFNKHIMKSIEYYEKASTKYAPLLTWKSWLFVLVPVFTVVLLPFNKTKTSFFDLFQIDFSISYWLDKIPTISGLTVSTVTFYALLFFGLMITIQSFLLKNYYYNRNQY